MKKLSFGLVAVFLALTATTASAQTESFATYVSTCKTQLGFTDAQMAAIASSLDCNQATIFAPNPGFGAVNDFMGYARLNDTVDLAFACRWLDNRTANRFNPSNPFTAPFIQAASVELMIHNRSNGNTCYFQAREKLISGPDGTMQSGVPVILVSPTVAAAAAPNTPAANFWVTPAELDSSLPCVDCHDAGPYIATPRIAPVLSRFGLLNNRHDTKGLTLNAQGQLVGNYHAVGTTFNHFNNIIAANLSTSTCAGACHNIAYNSTAEAVFHNVIGSDVANILIPSITGVFDSAGTGNTDISVITSGAMPPYNFDSAYRWINLDTPGNGVETENFADAMAATNTPVPYFLPTITNFNCPFPSVPRGFEAHAVGIDAANAFIATPGFSQNFGITETLKSFNLKDGLVCLNSDQDPFVTCRDFDVSYLCTNGSWTQFFNHTVNSGGGDDHEERSTVNTQVVAACGNTQPVGIRARYFISGRGGPIPQIVVGPNDRLARLSQYGLTCNNSDQPDGQCSNYVVRYDDCTTPPATVTQHLTSVWSGTQLTATSSTNNTAVKGQTPAGTNAQQWAIEPVTNTEFVRLRDLATNTYLTVPSSTESVAIVSSTSSTSTNQQWVIEPVVFTGAAQNVRLRNLGTGKYLTLNNTSSNSPILSQTKNASWASQRWLIN